MTLKAATEPNDEKQPTALVGSIRLTEGSPKNPDPANQAEDAKTYLGKKIIDAFVNPWLILTLSVLIVFHKQLRSLADSLQSLKIGPVELVRLAITEIKSEIDEGSLQFDVGRARIPISDFIVYPQRIRNEIFSALAFPFHWQAEAVRLAVFEARLSIQEDRLRTSPLFDEEKPPKDFNAARLKLFSMYLSLANFYGFAEPEAGPDINLARSLADRAYSYIQKAVALRPDAGEELGKTIGYARFCEGAIKGLRGLRVLKRDDDLSIEDGEILIREAIKAIALAERNEHAPPYQYHLKALLRFRLGDFKRAARDWRHAAQRFTPPSSRIYFNLACALSKLKKYSNALTELEHAIAIDMRNPLREVNLRNEAWNTEPDSPGAEFIDFKNIGDAQRARSASGKSFEEILGQPRPTPHQDWM
jgi:tetratricopeptide (TPR) repeat protein